MRQNNRREFLRNVGSGMLVAGVGGSLAAELGFSSAFAFDTDESEYRRVCSRFLNWRMSPPLILREMRIDLPPRPDSWR